MEMEDKNNYKYIKYNDFWQNNLQRLEEITKLLERDFYKLEKKYSGFDSIYDEIITEIDTIGSIYSSFNNIHGREYVFKLKSLLQNYKKRYTREGIDFKTIHYLKTKINELMEMSFDQFPQLDHTYIYYKNISDNTLPQIDSNIRKYNELKKSAHYKWITFTRNGSRFITPYDNLQIKKPDEIEISKGNNSKIKIRTGDTYTEVIDLFNKFSENSRKIKFFLVVEYKNTVKCFAVEKFGRIIMSERNFISPGLRAIKKSSISSGRFRLFGKNHIYI